MKHLTIDFDNLVIGEGYTVDLEGTGSLDMMGWDGVAALDKHRVMLSGSGKQRVTLTMAELADQLILNLQGDRLVIDNEGGNLLL